MSAKLFLKCDLCGKEKSLDYFQEMKEGLPSLHGWITRDFQTRIGIKIVEHTISTCSQKCDHEIFMRLKASTSRFVPRVFFEDLNNAPRLDS